MLFSSIVFLLYFLPAVLVVYWLCSFSRFLQNQWLLVVSLVFYAWGEPLFVFAMIVSILLNWLFGILVHAFREDRRRARAVIVVMVIFNIGLLIAVKYLGFLVDNLNAIVGQQLIDFKQPPLPLGVSFFTFQALSYVLDVNNGTAKVDKNPLSVGLYIALFPALVAGPIVRYSDVAEQLQNRRCSWDDFAAGSARFVIGLGKKMFIANAMGSVADKVFDLTGAGEMITAVPVTLAWLGVAAYTLQIYFDFSAYSDMALGLARMFGFRFRENFDYPYISTSVTEFWRRWHISLSTWFKEYVYIPLGGSRPVDANGKPLTGGKKSVISMRNIFVVWLLTGIWHGADWTFIFWGLWYFALLVLERTTNFASRNIPAVLRHAYLLFVTMIGWMFFRANNTHEALSYLGNMTGVNNNGFYSDTALMFLRENWLFFLLGVIFSTPVARNLGIMMEKNQLGFSGKILNFFYPFALLGLYVLCLVYLAKGGYIPFIYFNF